MNLALCFLVLLPQSKKDFPTRIASEHYDLKTTCAQAQGQELLDFMELVHKTYMALLKPENPDDVSKKKSTILLYKDYEEYLANGAPKGSGAYYSTVTKELVGYYDATMMRPFFAHEGMHQFTDLTSRNFKDFPMWFTEGIADCIGNCEVRDKKLYMCVKSGPLARGRLPVIQDAVKNNKQYRLADLFRLDQRKFMGDADLCYAQSWSFCHFLITYPKEEDRAHQIPDGKFRRNIATYYEIVRKGGTSHDKAWAEAFKDIPLDQLEELWKKYVLELDGGKYLGIQGKEVEDPESLKIEKGYSAIKIDKTVKDGVAAKIGLKDGDVLVSFDGKRFQKGKAMENLRQWMQDVPYGRAVKLKALRDGKEVEVTATWSRK